MSSWQRHYGDKPPRTERHLRRTKRPLTAAASGSHADAGAAPFAADAPTDPPASDNAGYLTADLPFQHRPPRHQAELERVLNECELAVADLHRTAADPLYVIAELMLVEGSPALPADLRRRGLELPPLQPAHQIGPEPVLLPLRVYQPLRRQPLQAPVDRLPNLDANPAPELHRLLGNDLSIEPCRSVSLGQKIKPVTAEERHRHRHPSPKPLLVRLDPLQVIGRDQPVAIDLPLDRKPAAA